MLGKRPLEDVALWRRADLVGAEVVGASAAGVVLRPVLRHVVRYRAGGGPIVAVDRGLGVRVDVIQERKAPDQGVGVRGDPFPEQGEVLVAVPARVVPQDLVVGAVLLDDEEDVLDRPVRPDRGVRGRLLLVDRMDLAVRLRRLVADLLVAREAQDARAAPHDRGQVLEAVDEVVGIVRGVRVGPFRFGPTPSPRAEIQASLPSTGARCRHGGVGAHGQAADELERLRAALALVGRIAAVGTGEREDRDGVLSGIGGEQVAAVLGDGHLGGASYLRPSAVRVRAFASASGAWC